MKIVLLGPPGSGKGTLAGDLKQHFGIPHVSTGDLFRHHVAENTELGREVKVIMEQGDLVPDRITIAMVRERFQEPDIARGFLLDGFPRTIPQAEALQEFMQIDHVLNLICGDQVIIQRLSGRRSCPKCGKLYHVDFMPPKVPGKCDRDGTELQIRDDDQPEAVRNRLIVYAQNTEPLIKWYSERNLLRDLPADSTPQDVARKALRILEA